MWFSVGVLVVANMTVFLVCGNQCFDVGGIYDGGKYDGVSGVW